MKKSLSVLALLLSLLAVLSFGSFSAFAESSDVNIPVSSEDTSEISAEESKIEAAVTDTASEISVAETTSEASAAETSDASAETTEETSEASGEESQSTAAATTSDDGGSFPWALVIFLGIVVVLVVVSVISIKANNRFGQWLKNFFKDHKSELKKVTWPSREFTVKNTIVVLVCLVVSGLVIGLLDFGLAKLVELLASLVS